MAKNRKHKLDKFYTKPSVVDLCLSLIDFDDFDVIIEPSAGNGSFSIKIDKCIALDIEPEHNTIIKQDYLKYNPPFGNNILVIGNPPFGNQSSLIFKFFKHSVFANIIAFILPKSFKKQSFQNRIPEYYHLMDSIDLPDNSFTLNGDDYNIPCVFQIWVKSNNKRQKPQILTPSSFEFTKKDDGMISIRRVGVNAGKLFMDTDRSESSHYFIKSTNLDKFINKYHSIRWLHDNTAGCNSISKQEIIKKIDFS